MIGFFRHRRMIKQAKHCLHEARHFRRMKEDIADPELIESTRAAERGLARAIGKRDFDAIEAAMQTASDRTGELTAGQKYSAMREHIEVAVVALSVAMAVRSYFFQPFKIPTGSMQPTLYGITAEPQTEPTFFDHFPLNYIVCLYTGQLYKEVEAKASGNIHIVKASKTDKYFDVGGIIHKVNGHLTLRCREGQFVRKGDIIASGRVAFGDHIFVDRVSYNFRKPKRGDIFVFRTDHIDHPDITPKTYYIKRLVGLPGETIEIDRYSNLLVDGKIWEMDYPENWSDEECSLLAADGGPLYIPGHNFARGNSLLARPGQRYTIADDRYLPMGDNTRSSLDGRYFGGVEREDIIGPAFMVYWPFNRRWGLID